MIAGGDDASMVLARRIVDAMARLRSARRCRTRRGRSPI